MNGPGEQEFGKVVEPVEGGREREFLTWLFRAKAVRHWAITAPDLEEYVRVNAAPGATRAALSYYRAIVSAKGLEASRARAERKLDLPILAFGAETGVGAGLIGDNASRRDRRPRRRLRGMWSLHAGGSAPRAGRAGP
jgi:hypothetical protein